MLVHDFENYFVDLHPEISFSMDNKITILDIARRTGLSKGTVDRVLHNRGEVSKKSYDKVMKVIKELGYEPNLYASMLASNRSYTIAVMIPDAAHGEFWEISRRGIGQAQASLRIPGIDLVHVAYDQYDGASFAEACRRVLEMNPDGVVLAPMYLHESLNFTGALSERQIPYVYIDSKIEEDNYLAYFGMPMAKSGALCADLLTQGRQIPSLLIVRIRRTEEDRYDPNLHRRAGFLDYLMAHSPECTIHYLFIDPTMPENIGPLLADFHSKHPEVRNLVMFNSRIYLLAPYLEKSGLKDLRVVGFDNLDDNLQALRRGSVNALIAQHPDRQVCDAIETLVEFIALKKRPAIRDHHVHMDILTKYNIDE